MMYLFIPPEWLALTLTVANAVLCGVIAWACICRFSMMSWSVDPVRVRFRIAYALMFVAAISSGASPVLWHEMPGPGQFGMAVAMAYLIGTGYGTWRHGVPDYATVPGRL